MLKWCYIYQEDIEVNLCDFGLGGGFLDLTPEVQMAKEKIDKLVLCEN